MPSNWTKEGKLLFLYYIMFNYYILIPNKSIKYDKSTLYSPPSGITSWHRPVTRLDSAWCCRQMREIKLFYNFIRWLTD